jgi:hypothetical protein
MCLNDRRVLRTVDLMKPSLIVVNLLSKLRIKCNYSENECQEILSFGSLSEHMKQFRNNNYELEMDENE